jgi:hypothetical protein
MKEQRECSPINQLFFNPETGEFEIAPNSLEIPSMEEQIKGMVTDFNADVTLKVE